MIQMKDRATGAEIQAEIEARMHLLNMDERLISHVGKGELFYSFIDELLPLTSDMKELINIFSKNQYEPYHVIYSKNGSKLYVLNVSLDKAFWSEEREPIGKSLELPCDVISLDSHTHKAGTVLFTSIAEDAFRPSERRPISIGVDSFPDFRNAWLSLKSFFDKRCF